MDSDASINSTPRLVALAFHQRSAAVCGFIGSRGEEKRLPAVGFAEEQALVLPVPTATQNGLQLAPPHLVEAV
jgi:hypothetical protein